MSKEIFKILGKVATDLYPKQEKLNFYRNNLGYGGRPNLYTCEVYATDNLLILAERNKEVLPIKLDINYLKHKFLKTSKLKNNKLNLVQYLIPSSVDLPNINVVSEENFNQVLLSFSHSKHNFSVTFFIDTYYNNYNFFKNYLSINSPFTAILYPDDLSMEININVFHPSNSILYTYRLKYCFCVGLPNLLFKDDDIDSIHQFNVPFVTNGFTIDSSRLSGVSLIPFINSYTGATTIHPEEVKNIILFRGAYALMQYLLNDDGGWGENHKENIQKKINQIIENKDFISLTPEMIKYFKEKFVAIINKI